MSLNAVPKIKAICVLPVLCLKSPDTLSKSLSQNQSVQKVEEGLVPADELLVAEQTAAQAEHVRSWSDIVSPLDGSIESHCLTCGFVDASSRGVWRFAEPASPTQIRLMIHMVGRQKDLVSLVATCKQPEHSKNASVG